MNIKINQDKLKELKNAEVISNRKSAYQSEADPIYFMSQRGESTEQEWLDKVQEIKERYPKV